MPQPENENPSTWWPGQLLRQQPVTGVVVCGRKADPPLFSHVVHFPRLEVPLGGCYENQIESGGQIITVPLRPGTALFAPPNCWNLPTWRHPVQVVSLLFGRKQLGVSLVTAGGGRNPGPTARKFSLPLPATGPLMRILDAVLELHAAGGAVEALPHLVCALMCCVEQSVLQPASEVAQPAKTLVEDVCVFLQSNYQYDITRDSVARQFGVSPNYLSRVFQVQGHMTFSSYLMHVRTDRAKHLLRNYNLKLDDIAARCGYRDTAYFCRVFKKLARVTPAAYRAQWKKAGGGAELE